MNMAAALTVTVVQCGVWIVWPNGLLLDRINTKKMFGSNRKQHARCAEMSFAFWMYAILKDHDKHVDSGLSEGVGESCTSIVTNNDFCFLSKSQCQFLQNEKQKINK